MFVIADHVNQGHQTLSNPSSVLPNGHASPQNYPNGSSMQNGHAHHQNSPPQPPPQRPTQQALPKETITVVGIPSVSVQTDRLNVGDSQSSSTRSYTPLKVLGDGTFGTVWLCDWHGTLPPNTPLSPMQCGAGARPEWVGKRLVAVKRMKRKWEGGWDECKKLKELESLRMITFHPNIIPLYDFFLLPASKELYFVFESMEGNLYHLIKARKGRPLAGGLVSSIFQQVVCGLDHIHTSGYFHRDMKPENILVTTTGLFDYQPVSPIAPPNAPPEKDVVAIIKLADFGLARETKSKPPYTEYVSTRWYRAPEVLLFSRDYSNPVDMWALGTIMAELVNLRPLFPGSGYIDQLARIYEVIGDPSDEYGFDGRGKSIGGGKWSRGVKMARAAGFAFPKVKPKDIYSIFHPSVPRSLIDCIADLLKYDPEVRLTSRQCLSNPYLLETVPKNNIPFPAGVHTAPPPPAFATKSPRNGLSPSASNPNMSRPIHPSHRPLPAPKSALESTIHDISTSHRIPFYPSPAANGHVHPIQASRPPGQNGIASSWDAEMSPIGEQPMDIHTSPTVPEYPARPHDNDALQDGAAHTNPQDASQSQGIKFGKLGSLGFGKKSNKWGLGGMFGQSEKHLPPVDEAPTASAESTPSLKRTQSTSTDSSEPMPLDIPVKPIDPKKFKKKEAERVEREAEIQRRALAVKMQREQARAVMQKRKQMTDQGYAGRDLEWELSQGKKISAPEGAGAGSKTKSTPMTTTTAAAVVAPGPVQGLSQKGASTSTLDAGGSRFFNQPDFSSHLGDWRNERMSKARRREFDDDHSMSSSDVQSLGRRSSISFADSDPGPSQLRSRPSLAAISRVTSRTSSDEFPLSTRSSHSLSAEHHFAHDFYLRASVEPSTPVSGSVSPPPVQLLSLSPSLSPSPTWMHLQGSQDNSSICSSRENQAYNTLLPRSRHLQSGPHSPYEFGSIPPSSYGHPSSPASHLICNPIFKVRPFPSPAEDNPPKLTLPSFSHLEAVADREYPPSSLPFHQPES